SDGPLGVRAAHDHGSGGPPAGPPATVQPGGHQRAGTSAPSVHAGPRARGAVPDGAARREHRAGDRDHELPRAAQLRVHGRLRRARRRRGPGGRSSLCDRGALHRGRRLSRQRPPRPPTRFEQARSPRGWVKFATTALERVAIVVASLALSFGLIAVLSGFFAGRDQAGVSITQTGPGSAFPDLGATHLKPGQKRPEYDSTPPTSGAHFPKAVTRDEAELDDDQLLTALEAGNVVFMYGTNKPPPGLRELALRLAGPFTPALAAAGQAVIL